MTKSAVFIFTALAMSVLAWPPQQAAAQQRFRAPTWGKVSGSAGLRVGTDDLGVGLGARLGYTFQPGVYLGGQLDFYFGDRETNTIVGDIDTTIYTVMVEGGYDFGVGKALLLRPMLGVGVIGFDGEECVAGICVSVSDTDMEVALGGQALYYLGKQFALGGELRILLAEVEELVLGFNAGLTF